MTTLSRRLGLAALIIYGIGDILGAGIYALVGKVIGMAGAGAWLTFLLAALVATLTGFSYAELSSRYPVAGGAAAYVAKAFHGRLMATLIGVLVLGTGLISASTVTVAFSGYLNELVTAPSWLAQMILVAGMSFLSFWGIQESSRANIILTLVELGGLILVIIAGVEWADSEKIKNFTERASHEWKSWGTLTAISVAFYAYIGFEDLSNLAEEAKNPKRDLPRAILIAIGFTSLIYLLVCLALLINVDEEMIANSKTPLLLIFEQKPYRWVLQYFSVIALMAITNTGLINLIMASRLFYGMAHEGLLPSIFGQIHARRRTPWVGVITAAGIVLILVFTGSLKVLAQTTSFLILVVFFFVHLSLLKVKWNREPHEGIAFHILLPFLGLLSCSLLFLAFPLEVYLRSLLLFFMGLIVWALQKTSWRRA